VGRISGLILVVKELLKTGTGKKEIKPVEPKEDPSIEIIYRQIEERLQQTLHTKVSIQRKRNGHGKLLIDFYNSDDLEKIILAIKQVYAGSLHERIQYPQ